MLRIFLMVRIFHRLLAVTESSAGPHRELRDEVA
jgi:hypothetical protein